MENIPISLVVASTAVLISAVTFFFQLWQNKKAAEAAFKNNFVSCTAKYTKIQEILLSNNDLGDLCAAIYKTASLSDKSNPNDMKKQPDPRRSLQVKGKEMALCAIMFQLMEDIFILHQKDLKQDREIFAGWTNLFKDWMSVSAIYENWEKMRHHFGVKFRDYTNEKYPKPESAVTT